MEKWNISKTKLVLQKAGNTLGNGVTYGHNCDKVFYTLLEDECEMFNNLHKLLDQLPSDIKSSITFQTRNPSLDYI